RLFRPGHIGNHQIAKEAEASSPAVYRLADERDAPGRDNLHYRTDVGAGLPDRLDVLLHLHVCLVAGLKSLDRVGDVATQPAEVLGREVAPAFPTCRPFPGERGCADQRVGVRVVVQVDEQASYRARHAVGKYVVDGDVERPAYGDKAHERDAVT